jgi:GntR family transcriptional regulator/MocR family aminotransferase
VYVGTLSKVVAPGLRIGFMVAPRELLERVTSARYYLDRQGDHATECALAELFEDGEIQRHVRRTRRVYQGRRDLFVELLQKTFGDRLEYRVPRGGMALWAKVDRALPVAAWLERAAAQGVLFHAGQQFDFDNRAIPFARFGFAGSSESELVEAVKRLERAR